MILIRTRESLSPYVARVRARYGQPRPLRRAAAAALGPLLPLVARATVAVPLLRRRLLAGRLFGLHAIEG